MESKQEMIEVLKSGKVLTVVPKENEEYYRDVVFRNHPDEKKISYRPHKTPEEREEQAKLIVKKINISEVKEAAKKEADKVKNSNKPQQ